MESTDRYISVLHHLLIFCSYAGLALAAALYAPQWVPELAGERALLAGLALFFCGAMGHELYARVGREVRFGEELLKLRRRQGAMQEELSWNRRQMMALREILEQASETAPEAKSKKNVDDVIAEVKVLQSLVTRLSKAQKKSPQPAAQTPGTPDADARAAVVRDEPATAEVQQQTPPLADQSAAARVARAAEEELSAPRPDPRPAAKKPRPKAPEPTPAAAEAGESGTAEARATDRPLPKRLAAETKASELAPMEPAPIEPAPAPRARAAGHGSSDRPKEAKPIDWRAIGSAVAKRQADDTRRERQPPDIDRAALERKLMDREAAEKRRSAQPEKTMPSVVQDLSKEQIVEVAREALQEDRVDVVLQPVVTLPQRKRVFYECFSRLRTGDGYMVLPEQYIALAEREGLVAAIDDMLLFRCIQLVRKIQSRGESFDFFCNLSRHTLNNEEFFADFVEFLAGNAELTCNLVFEFSQADFNTWDDSVAQKLDRLARLGCRFSLDGVVGLDFDLEALASYEIRFVKIDSLLLLADPEYSAVLAHDLTQLQIEIIAEKVETEEALVEVLDLGVKYAQGYLFSEPRLARPAA